MAYQHGVRVIEQSTSVVAPIEGTAGLQVVFGTAPVNLVSNPYEATNTPIIAYSWNEAVSKLGYSEDFANYTLCQSMYACFKLLAVAPVIFVNVLDPMVHKKENEPATVQVENLKAVVKTTGILLDTVTVSTEDGEKLVERDDYVLAFDDDGNLAVVVLPTGSAAAAKSLTVNSESIDPTAVTADDIIGASADGTEKGLEVLRQVYPKFGMTPGLIIAPGWSQNPDVGAVIAAKCEEINGYFSCEAFIDIDSSEDGCTAYTDVKAAKELAGIYSPHIMPLWPCVQVGSKIFHYSAIMAALTAYTDAANDDVPNLSPSNRLVGITGTVLEDGTEIVLDQIQANAVNSHGVTTAINVNGWRTWGNNTAAYPTVTDPKDRWFCCRRFFSWWGNTFIQTYFQKVDNPANSRLIESIVDSENIRGNAYVSAGKCAAAYIEYNAAENTAADLLNGKITFHQHLAPYVPTEDILNVLEFDADALKGALTGGK